MRFNPDSLRVRLPPRELDLYFALLNRGKWVVTSAEAVDIANVSRTHADKILHGLNKRHALRRVGKGVYVIAPPDALYEKRPASVDPFRVLDQLMRAFDIPYYTAYSTAAFLHGASHEMPFNVHVATPRQRRPISLGSANVVFHKVPADRMSGTTRIRQSGEYLTVSGIERTLLDCASRLDLCGGAEGLAQIASELAQRANGRELAAQAGTLAHPAAVQRLGFILARLSESKPPLASPHLTKQLFKFVGKTVYTLDPAREETGSIDDSWKVRVNVDVLGWLRA